MSDKRPINQIDIRLISRPDHRCWDLRCVIDGIVMHSRRVVHVENLTHAEAKYIFNAVEMEIDSWLR
jgi:hypothetical protein